MSKNVILAVIAVLVIGGGGAAYVLTKDDNGSNKDSTSSNNAPAKASAVSGNINDFLAKDDAKECTYNMNDNGSQVSGTMYFANKRMRHNYTGTSSTGAAQNGGMIVTEGAQYVWDNTNKQGIKMAFNTSQTSQTNTTQNQGVDANKQYEFTCKDWKADESFFMPPSDVMMNDMTNLQIPGQQ